jgi:hypothetical protein
LAGSWLKFPEFSAKRYYLAMRDHVPIWLANAGGCLVSGATFVILGWNGPAAHAAARNTARFSAFCYIVALASPGLFLLSSRRAKLGMVSVGCWLPKERRLIQAFVAAHMVHFATVVVVIAVFDIGRIQKNPVAYAGGFAITAGLGLTAGRESGRQIVLHQVLFYLFFVIFLVALSRSLFPRLLDALMVVAFVLRMMSRKHIAAAEGSV